MIFVSHSSKDKVVIDDFVDLLQKGCNLNIDFISCTSVEGADIKTGEEFIEWIENTINESCIVILFITPNYYGSSFCIAEMGAAWGLKKSVFPIMAPDVDRDAGIVLTGRQTQKIDKEGLDKLRDEILGNCGITSTQNTARWNSKRNAFLRLFNDKYYKITKDSPVPIESYRGLQDELEATQNLYDECQEELSKHKEQVKRLESLKDKDEVNEVKKDYMSDLDTYNNYINELHSILSDISAVTIRCLYASLRGELWIPEKDDKQFLSKDIENEIEYEHILIDHFDMKDGYIANTDHKKIGRILQKLHEFQNFLESEMKEEDFEYLDEHRDFPIKLENRAFWEEEIGIQLLK
jgi:hypothetical protein